MSQPVTSTAIRSAEPAADPAADGGAFGQQLVALTSSMQAFLRTLCRGGAANGSGIDDLVQETMARAWRSRATFDADKGTPAAWLSRIAFRVYLDHRDLSEPARTLVDEHAAGGPGPLAEAAAREQIRTLLGRLGRREREVLLHFHRDGRSIAELAAAEAVPTGTIKSLLHRARARLWAAFLHGEQP
jgi:RNA polymerase sigma-70 factor (ECF subfamily)